MGCLLVRALLRSFAVLRTLAIGVVLLSLTSQPVFAQAPTFPYRADVVRMLQQLVATGYPLDNEHDDGEWLQALVNYAVAVRDGEIEHLAMRAAVPLRARVDRPVSTIEAPAHLEVLSYQVLELPRPVPYTARIEASIDDGPYLDLGTQASGTPLSIRLDRLGASALRAGTHVVRVRARMVFGDPQQPVHSEVRELAPMTYALYDEQHGTTADARRFIYSPTSFKASDFDRRLPSQPLMRWLGEALSKRAELADARMWTSRYCSELTHEHHAKHDAGGLCTVIYFSNGSAVGQLWFRTGRVDASDDGPSWRQERPSFEALRMSNGRAASRLSALPSLLDEPYDPDIRVRTVSAPDIVITPAAPKRNVTAKAVITLHNSGDVAVQNLKLEVVHLDGSKEGGMRHFVIDVPPHGSTSVSLDVAFRNGYGLIVALPFIKDHGIVQDLMGAPLDTPCAVRVVNAAAAPRDYVRMSVGHLTYCVSR
jgi:hypothetical protein